VITGAEEVKNWVNDDWRATLPNSFFGQFNSFNDLIHGDLFNSMGRQHHTGAVYLGDSALAEAARYDWRKAAGSGSERKTPSENARKSSAFRGFPCGQ